MIGTTHDPSQGVVDGATEVEVVRFSDFVHDDHDPSSWIGIVSDDLDHQGEGERLDELLDGGVPEEGVEGSVAVVHEPSVDHPRDQDGVCVLLQFPHEWGTGIESEGKDKRTFCSELLDGEKVLWSELDPLDSERPQRGIVLFVLGHQSGGDTGCCVDEVRTLIHKMGLAATHPTLDQHDGRSVGEREPLRQHPEPSHREQLFISFTRGPKEVVGERLGIEKAISLEILLKKKEGKIMCERKEPDEEPLGEREH